jgi:hypothetical protein
LAQQQNKNDKEEVITVVITSKTQIKEKELKGKQWVISQECFSLTPLS